MKLTVRLKQHEALGLAEGNPLSIRREFWKVIAHSIV
jgi:hypothetical protein